EDADDLMALIEALEIEPSHVIANSFGGLVTLNAVARRPELFVRLALHEPPGIGVLMDDPAQAGLLQGMGSSIASVVSKLEAGEHEAGAREFVDEVALGPGTWDQLPGEAHEMFVRNAPTFLDESRDPNALAVDLSAVSSLEHPILLTEGDESPPFYSKVI